MAAKVANIALGKVGEYAARVNANDPANSVLVLIALRSTATIETLQDFDTLAAIIAEANTDEVTNSGYARIVLDQTAGITVTVDDSGNQNTVDFPDQTFREVREGDRWAFLVLGYDSDSTSGTDANIVPCCIYDFVVTPNGGNIGVVVNASGAYVARAA